MRKLLLLLGLVVGLSTFGFSQTITSAQAGNWNVSTTWVGSVIPTNVNSTLIQINHSVTIPSGFTAVADQIAVAAGITFTVSAGGTLDLRSSGGTDLTLTEDNVVLFVGASFVVNGDYLNSSLTAINYGTGTSTIAFNSGGRYVHAIDGLSLPPTWTTWNANSTCQINGVVSTAPGNINQTFGNFTWNCASQSGNVALGLTSATISGNLSILNTAGPGIVTFASGPGTVTINGNFSVSGNSRFLGSNNANVTMNVGGDFSFASTATNFSLLIAGAGVNTMNFNVKKNFSVTAGTLQARSGSTAIANVNFNGSTSQTYNISGGTLSGPFNWTIKNGSIVDLGTSAFVNSGNFTLEGGGTMKVGSPDGLVAASTTLGNVQVSGTRTYTVAGNIVYNGSVAQNLGSEWASGGGLNAVSVNLEIANSNVSGVTNNIIGSTNVVGNLTLTNGSLNIGNSNTLNVQSVFAATSGTFGGSSTSNLTFSGSGAMGIVSFASGTEFLNNLTITRTTTVQLGSNLTVSGTIALTNGNLAFSGFTLTMNGGAITATSNGLISSSTSNLIFGGSTFSGTVPFSGTNQLNNLTFGTPSGAFTWNSPVTVNTALTLNAGALTHTSGLTMATNSTVFKGGGSISGAVLTAVTSYNVNYTGTGNTGLELPTTSTALNNLTINSSGTVTLASNNITINGTALFSGGTLSAGSNSLTMKGAAWTLSGGLFTAGTGTVTFSGATTVSGAAAFNNVAVTTGNSLILPSAIVTISGNLANDGTLTPGSGTVTFSGTTTISGASTSSFNNITLTGTLNAPAGNMNVAGAWTNNAGTFNSNSGTVVFNGTSTIGGSSTTNFYSVQINGSSTLTGPVTLNIAKNFTNNGTFIAGTNIVLFNGSTAQSIGGTTNTSFYNITSSNVNVVTVSTAQSLTGALTLGSSGTFAAGGLLTLISTATGDARIAQITGTAVITGGIIAQRWLPNAISAAKYRYLASPVTNSFASDWMVEFPVTGTFTDPSTAAQWPGLVGPSNQTTPSMYIYNESHTPTTTTSDRYESFPPNGSSSTSTALVNGKGYTAFVYKTSPFVIDLNGTPAQGAIGVGVTNQSGSIAANDGWNLIGNPYAAPISWDLVTIPAGVGTQIALKDNTNNAGTGAGAYIYYTQGTFGAPGSGIGTGGYNGTIPSGQAFFTRSSNIGTTTITFQESSKMATASPQFLRQGSLQDLLRVKIVGNNNGDEMVIYFREGANDAADLIYDAFKLKNDFINLSSLATDGQKLAINGMSKLECFKQVPVVLEGVNLGAHTFNFTGYDSFSDQIHILLVDAFAGTSVNVNQANPAYNFNVTSDPASSGSSRFKLIFGEAVSAITVQNSARCNAGTLTLTALGASDGNYRWYEAATGGTPITGATSSTFTTPALTKSQTFYVASTNSLGCEEMRLPVVAMVTTLDPVVISVKGRDFQSSYARGNQWYFNGQLIPGATGQTYTPAPQQGGVYKVEVTSLNCTTSAEREYVITGLEVEIPSHISIYPNPVTEVLTVAVQTANEVNAKLITLLGTPLYDQSLTGGTIKKGSFNMQEQSEGMYILIVQDGSQIYKIRIIKKR